jgi:hypothetical protein
MAAGFVPYSVCFEGDLPHIVWQAASGCTPALMPPSAKRSRVIAPSTARDRPYLTGLRFTCRLQLLDLAADPTSRNEAVMTIRPPPPRSMGGIWYFMARNTPRLCR